MPTILSHPAVPLAIAGIIGRKNISSPLLIASVIASILPDADVVCFKFGIPYQHWLGHRGFFHSVTFAIIIVLFGILFGKYFGKSRWTIFFVLFISTVSHGLLDAITDGGLGIAFFSPFSSKRFFFPWQPIAVSPLSVSRLISLRGWTILKSELLWVWLPCISLGIVFSFLRDLFGQNRKNETCKNYTE